MSDDDMTYEPVTDVTTLRRTAQEANQYALCMEDKANELAARVQELERENAELRARLDAVPEYVRFLVRWRAGDGHVLDFDEWYSATHTAQPDDTDAPLKLAALDEDGDL